MARFLPEPFRTKPVERIELTTREEQAALLAQAGFNPCLMPTANIYVYLLRLGYFDNERQPVGRPHARR